MEENIKLIAVKGLMQRMMASNEVVLQGRTWSPPPVMTSIKIIAQERVQPHLYAQ